MQIDFSSALTLLDHIWTVGSDGIICAVVVAAASLIWKKLKSLSLNSSNWVRDKVLGRRGAKHSVVRGIRLRELKFLRTYQFDEAWINREVSRGHTSQIIFLLWFGFWIMAAGLKNVVTVSGAPLSASPIAMLLGACPMYVFEVLWIYHSSAAAKIIRHRQKVKIWRYRH